MIFSRKHTIYLTHRSQKHLKYVDIHLAIDQALEEHKNVVKLCELWSFIYLTLTLIPWSWVLNLT